MNIQIDESVEIRIVDLMGFADGQGCELVSQNGEILIRARLEADTDNVVPIRINMNHGLPMGPSETVVSGF